MARLSRRPLSALLAVAASAPLVARAEPNRVAPPRNAITLEPLSVVFARTIALEYERGFGHFGVHLGGALTLGDLAVSAEPPRTGDYLALAATAGVRIYPWTEAPAGPFFGPFASFTWVEAESSSTDGPATSSGLGWSVGAMAGWTWLLASFELSLGLGVAYHRLDIDSDAAGGARDLGRDGVLPALRLAVGAAF